MTSPQEFKTLLASFESAHDIAGYLQRHGIKGRQTAVMGCPLAVLARLMGLGPVYVSPVRTEKVCAYEDNRDMWIFQNPEVVQRFILNFDAGQYPELVEA